MSSIDEKCSWAEFAAVVLSRELKDGEVGSPGGSRSEIPVAAARLAQLTHAPNLTIITSAVGFVANVNGKTPAPLCGSTMDWRNYYAGTEAILGASVFQSRRDWFFASGLQVDGYGNLNLNRVRLPDGQEFRGPGGAGLSYASSMARRFFIYMHEHSKRSFVKQLDFTTAIGWGNGPGTRGEYKLRGGGPALVLSPRAVMDFEPDTRRLRLRSIHRGQTIDQVLSSTGCELVVPSSVPQTPMPSDSELRILRDRVDISGVLHT